MNVLYPQGEQSRPLEMLPLTPRHDVHPFILGAYPKTTDKAICISSWSHYENDIANNRFQKIRCDVGEEMSDAYVDILKEYFDFKKIPDIGKSWIERHVSYLEAYHTHYELVGLVRTFVQSESVRSTIQNEGTCKKILALCRDNMEVVKYYLSMNRWFVEKTEFAVHISWLFEEVKGGRSLLSVN